MPQRSQGQGAALTDACGMPQGGQVLSLLSLLSLERFLNSKERLKESKNFLQFKCNIYLLNLRNELSSI